MASPLDLLLAVTDPVNAMLLGGIYLRIRGLSDRVNRLEGTFITDGGRVVRNRSSPDD